MELGDDTQMDRGTMRHLNKGGSIVMSIVIYIIFYITIYNLRLILPFS